MPREVFVAGQILTAAELNTVSDQTVMSFAGTAARGSAIPSPVEGMVSYLQDLDRWEGYTTSWGPLGGKILQVISTSKTDTFSTSSTSYTDITGMSVSITPIAASSKILVFAQLMGDNSAGDLFQLQLLRGATAINIGDASGSRTRTSALLGTFEVGRPTMGVITFLDSPATTSATTYKLQGRVNSGTGFLNRANNDTDNSFAPRNSSTITVLEVSS